LLLDFVSIWQPFQPENSPLLLLEMTISAAMAGASSGESEI
jgi:hypothetical protein